MSENRRLKDVMRLAALIIHEMKFECIFTRHLVVDLLVEIGQGNILGRVSWKREVSR